MATDRHERTRVLFERHADELYRYIQCLAPGEIDPKDVVQESFVRVFTSLHQLRSDSMARAWLYRIARNILYDVLRRRQLEIRCMRLESRGVDTGGIGSSLEVLEAMKSLPLAYQQTLYLHAVKGFQVHEIAEILGKTPIAVRVAIHRARKSLAKQLGFHDTPRFEGASASKGGS